MSNATYRGSAELPDRIPVFPLEGALLLPRGELPLNIFEPRYLRMVDDAMAGARIIGMIQPKPADADTLYETGCAGRITQFAETGDGRYLITLTGIARFRVAEELPAGTPYRQARIDFTPFEHDFVPHRGEDEVNRDALLRTLAAYLDANRIEADWSGIREAPTEALVNGLSMMSPYGPKEKQALLEAPDLRSRAELLIAVTEFALAEKREGGETIVQ